MDGVSCASLMHISTRTFAFFFFFSFFFGIKKKKIESTAVWGAFRCHRLLERLGGRVRCLLSAALSYMQINRGVWRAEEGGGPSLQHRESRSEAPAPRAAAGHGAAAGSTSANCEPPGAPPGPARRGPSAPAFPGCFPLLPIGLSRGRKRELGFAGVARGDPHPAVPCRPGIT